MRRGRLLCTILCITLVWSAPAVAQFGPVVSAPLLQTLDTIRNLSDSSFHQLVWWAPNPQDPNLTAPDWNNAEHQIMQLPRRDRDAVLSWLTGHGRDALYRRGATDSMIGARTPNGVPSSQATPSPLQQYRVLQLTSPTLRTGASSPGNIDVRSGFALIARNGTKAIVCLSFTNVAPVAAKNVHFNFPLIAADGTTLGSIDFNRAGSFAPNVNIDGPANASAYFDPGLSNRGAFDNCVTSDQGTAALPLLQARYVAYKVAGVTYSDGSAWP
jgi:hypothetical protein